MDFCLSLKSSFKTFLHDQKSSNTQDEAVLTLQLWCRKEIWLWNTIFKGRGIKKKYIQGVATKQIPCLWCSGKVNNMTDYRPLNAPFKQPLISGFARMDIRYMAVHSVSKCLDWNLCFNITRHTIHYCWLISHRHTPLSNSCKNRTGLSYTLGLIITSWRDIHQNPWQTVFVINDSGFEKAGQIRSGVGSHLRCIV